MPYVLNTRKGTIINHPDLTIPIPGLTAVKVSEHIAQQFKNKISAIVFDDIIESKQETKVINNSESKEIVEKPKSIPKEVKTEKKIKKEIKEKERKEVKLKELIKPVIIPPDDSDEDIQKVLDKSKPKIEPGEEESQTQTQP